MITTRSVLGSRTPKVKTIDQHGFGRKLGDAFVDWLKHYAGAVDQQVSAHGFLLTPACRHPIRLLLLSSPLKAVANMWALLARLPLAADAVSTTVLLHVHLAA